jgi:hypothetical protein
LLQAAQAQGIPTSQFSFVITVKETQAPFTPLPYPSTPAPPNYWAQYTGTVAITGTANTGFWTNLADVTLGFLMTNNNNLASSMVALTPITVSG